MTRGPWVVYEGGNFVKIATPEFAEYVEKSGYLGGPFCVATLNEHQRADHEPTHELAMANARLLALAPEMLELLIAISRDERPSTARDCARRMVERSRC